MGWSDDYLEHHGILGQKWGVRRFENKNGTLTPAGRKRYDTDEDGDYKKIGNKTPAPKASSEGEPKKKGLSDKQKKVIIAGAAIAGTALAAYGGYKLYQLNKQATEGLSKDYHNQAVKEFVKSRELETKYNSDMSSKTFNAALDARDRGEALQDLAKNKKYSIGEKAAYLNLQKAKASTTPKTNDDQLKSKKQVTKVLKDYNKDRIAWDKKTINLESQKRMAERRGDEAKANKIEKKLASSPPPIPPQFSKKGQAATNKLASEASALAKSVTTEGPKSFSKPTQNGPTKSQMTQQKLKAAQESHPKIDRATVSHTPIDRIQIDRATVNRVKVDRTPINMDSFNKAAQANDDLVNSLLKKNASALKGY